MGLYGKIIERKSLTKAEIAEMFQLMEQFYDDTSFSVFLKDLQEKDYCILLYAENRLLRGFSTQMILSVQVGDEKVHGIFSGDTIIHKDYWGSLELFKIFAKYFIPLGSKYPDFYWFLITKGYKTYKMLPVFFKQFYPNCEKSTPKYEQEILHAFGRIKFPNEYEETSGVIVYRGIKDKLKSGVADITESRLKDKHIQHFLRLNPEYYKGNDLVCITRLTADNFHPAVRRLLLGKDQDV